MHALCTIIAKRPSDIYDILQQGEEADRWDYATIGGRYCNIIPIGKNAKGCKRLIAYLEDGVCPFEQGNPDCKYVSMARLRNVKINECERQLASHYLSPLAPYSIIIDTPIGQVDEMEFDSADKASILELINTLITAYGDYYIAVVDYHF